MQNWAVLLLVLGAIAGLLAFTSFAAAWTFIFLAVVLLLDGVMLLTGRGRRGMIR